MIETITLIYCFLVLFTILILLFSFGNKIKNHVRKLEFEESDDRKELILNALKIEIRQQRIAFTLLCCAATISFLFGLLLIGNFLLVESSEYNIKVIIAEAIGIAGGGGVTLTFFRLYNKASKKVEIFLSTNL